MSFLRIVQYRQNDKRQLVDIYSFSDSKSYIPHIQAILHLFRLPPQVDDTKTRGD